MTLVYASCVATTIITSLSFVLCMHASGYFLGQSAHVGELSMRVVAICNPQQAQVARAIDRIVQRWPRHGNLQALIALPQISARPALQRWRTLITRANEEHHQKTVVNFRPENERKTKRARIERLTSSLGGKPLRCAPSVARLILAPIAECSEKSESDAFLLRRLCRERMHPILF